MYYASTPALASAVTSAGAFGFIAAGFKTSQELINELQSIHNNLGIPRDIPLPAGVGFLGWILDTTETSDHPRLSAVLEQMPVAIWFAFGLNLGKYVAQVRAFDSKQKHRTLVFVIVNSVTEALTATDEWGVDVLVVQGNEAGGHGHSNAPPLLTLLPAVIAALCKRSLMPAIVAAGGISTGSQIAGLLTIGADGVAIGSHFLCSPECMYSDSMKEVIINAGFNATIRSKAFDEVNRTALWPAGIDGRAVYNDILKDVELGIDLEDRLKRYDEGLASNENSRLVIWAGVGIGFVNSRVDTKHIVEELYKETIAALQKVCKWSII